MIGGQQSVEETEGGPLVYRRRVRWGEGDPAHIVYTVRFLDFAMEAIEEWFRQVLDIDWYRLNLDRGMGSPAVHVELDFEAPVKPGDLLEIPVLVRRLGDSSITFELPARIQGGGDRFRAVVVHALIDNGSMRAIAIPPEYRVRIEGYVARTEESDERAGRSWSRPRRLPEPDEGIGGAKRPSEGDGYVE